MAHDKRNILFILTDQFRADAIGCYGNEICQTPNIDRLASEGMVFDRAYTTCSLCSPARSSLMTGQFPHSFGMLGNVEAPGSDMKEMEHRPYLNSEILKREGYNLGYTGKWHLGEKVLPRDFGFEGDNFPGHGGGGMHYPEFKDYLKERGIPDPYPDKQGGGYFAGLIPGGSEGTVPYFLAENTNALLSKFASDWKEDGKPFYMWCNFWGPHHPCYATEEFLSMYRDADIPPWENFEDSLENKPLYQRYLIAASQRNKPWSHWREAVVNYYAFASLIDSQIGRMLDHLSALGLDEDTLVIFSADHGDSIGFHGGLSDKTGFTYEENYRIPLIIRDPSLPRSQGVREDRLVSLADYVPTWLDAVGIAPPDEAEGVSLMPLLRRDESVTWRDKVFAEFHGFIILCSTRMIRTERYKYVYNATDLDEFYDLEEDPYELDNRIANPECRETIYELQGLLLDWMKETGDIVGRRLAIKRSYFEPGVRGWGLGRGNGR